MEVQGRCFQLGIQMVELFDIIVTTKLHRFMRLIHCHLTSFGMLRWGANDKNQSLHKAVKKAYSLTNRHSLGFSRQQLPVVQAGYVDDYFYPQQVQQIHLIRILSAPIRCTEREIASRLPLSDRIERDLRLSYRSSKRQVWTTLKYVTLDTKLPLQVDQSIHYIPSKYLSLMVHCRSQYSHGWL